MSKKIAVVMFNLGGPDCKESIRPFLLNFFMDKNIINAPAPIRYLLANWIAYKRSKREAGRSYAELGNASPLLQNMSQQARVLEETLNNNLNSVEQYKAFVCMRYWHPMSDQAIRDVQDWGADKIVLLPLYPQFSITTTWSSYEDWNRAALEVDMDKIETSMVCCYPENEGFIRASAENIAESYQRAKQAGHENIRILFSAHGLPEKVIKKGDIYQNQCEKTSSAIVKCLEQEFGMTSIDWQNCYQSRIGPMKWIGPSTEEAIKKAADDETAVIIYPHAFTQEHVETLVELDIEYRELAEKIGQKGYYRAQTVGINTLFIEGLADLVFMAKNRNDVIDQKGRSACCGEFSCCNIKTVK